MAAAIEKAVDCLAKSPAERRSVVYLGDGMSAANLLGTEQFEELVSSLVENKIALTGYAVGPRLDGQLLGALVANTGGVLIDGSEDVDLNGAGQALAVAAEATVLWPDQATVTFPKDAEIYPMRTPPLRADRETILIGKSAAKLSEAFDYEIRSPDDVL